MACIFCVLPFSVHAERIDSFDTLITIHKDSTFEVVENIHYLFTSPKHGIFRTIPTTHPEQASKWYNERYTDITVTQVLFDGASVLFVLDDSNKQIYLKIGDPETTITGAHTYTIAYTVEGGVSYPTYGGAELYWNVVGSDWDVPIRSVQTTISSPDGLLMREHSCYQGKLGLNASCNPIADTPEGTLYTTSNLSPGEGMTIAQALDVSKIDKVEFERVKPIFLWICIPSLWFLILGVFVYRYRTANRTGRTIIPQYEPYPGVKPMYTGLLVDGTLDSRDITACIVYLAEQGFLKIEKKESKVLFFFEVDDYEITLMKQLDETISRFQQSILSLLFDHGAIPGTKVTLGTLRNDLVQQQRNHVTLQELKRDLEQDLKDSGFFQITVTGIHTLTSGMVIAIGILFFSGPLMTWLGLNGVLILLFVVGSLLILTFMRRRRTTKGYEALDHLRGFKEFLSVSEEDRYAFHNAPEKSPVQFMEYLPYAIAFGVEEKWADVFKDIVIENPDWYDSGASGQTFSPIGLTTSLGAFSTAFATSSGSGGSASSGGGSSGGGGGGGGGGSW